MRIASLPQLGIALLLVGTPVSAYAWRNFQPPAEIVDIQRAADGALVVAGSGGFYVAKMSADTGAILWSIGDDDQPPFGQALAVAIDADNDVLAAGYTQVGVDLDAVLSIRKLANSDGATLWRRDIPSIGINGAAAVAKVGGSPSDVIAGGSDDVGTFVAYRLSGLDGSTMWHYELGQGTVYAVVVDASGGVIVAGTSADQATMAKLDATTGAEIWRTELGSGWIGKLALTASGDLIGGGRINYLCAVSRLAGATGLAAWTSLTGAGTVEDLELTATGNVVAAGTCSPNPESRFAALALDGATGAQLWVHQESPGAEARAVAVDAGSGAVVVAGLVWGAVANSLPLERFLVEGLDPLTGVTAWAHVVDGTRLRLDNGAADTAIADGQGHVFVGGRQDYDRLGIVARFGVDGTPGLVQAKSIQVRDRAGEADDRSFSASSGRDALIIVPSPGSADDPITAGATIRIANPTTGESATFALPAGGAWRGLGTPPGAKGYRYSDPQGANGPCTSLLAQPGKKLKLRCLGRRGPIGFSLDEASQGTMTASVRLGSFSPQCLAFGATIPSSSIARDYGTASPGPGGLYRASAASSVDGLFGASCDAP